MSLTGDVGRPAPTEAIAPAEPAPRERPLATAPAGRLPLDAAAILRLQPYVGNAAIARAILARSGEKSDAAGMSLPSGASAVAPPPGGPVSSQPPDKAPAGLESPHPEVNKRPVGAVGTDLHTRLERYNGLIPSFRKGAAETQKDEVDWYANKGLGGWIFERFNKENPTDPKRWDAVLKRWDDAAAAMQPALAIPVTTDKINDLGLAGQKGFNVWQDAAEQTRLRREEYSKYLRGFTTSGEGVVMTTTLVRDVSFAAAVGLAVVVAAPVVAGGVAAFGTGTLGLTAGSTGLAAFTYGGTALAMGGLGMGMEGAGQGLATLGAQASMAMADLIAGRAKAADNFDFSEVGAQTWDGMKRGFVDGVLAFTGLEAEKFIASAGGPAVRALFGPGNSSLYATLLRRTLQRAVSGGITGSVIGALQAGYRAAAEGQNLAGIEASMKYGFLIGGAAGTALGGAGGAWEARGAIKIQQQVATALRAKVPNPPASMADDALLSSTLDKMRANPTGGKNAEILELTPKVWKALHDPDRIAGSLADIWLEEHLLGVMAPRSASERYGEAARVLAKRAGAPVIVLPRGTKFTPDAFFNDIVVSGNRFLDYSALDLAQGDHGATTHLIQDHAVDLALKGTGTSAQQYRALLAKAVGPNGEPVGVLLWESMYDSFAGGINQPEVVYPVIRQAVPVP